MGLTKNDLIVGEYYTNNNFNDKVFMCISRGGFESIFSDENNEDFKFKNHEMERYYSNSNDTFEELLQTIERNRDGNSITINGLDVFLKSWRREREINESYKGDDVGFIIKTTTNRFIGINDIIVTKIKLAKVFHDKAYVLNYLDDIKTQYSNTDYKFLISKIRITEI